MQTVVTLNTDSDHAASLARDIAEGLTTGNPRFAVRTPAHRSAYTPLLDVVSEAIGAPQDPILTALLALVAGGLKSTDAAQARLATGAMEAIARAHIEAQIDAAIEEDSEALGMFVPAPWSREGRRAA